MGNAVRRLSFAALGISGNHKPHSLRLSDPCMPLPSSRPERWRGSQRYVGAKSMAQLLKCTSRKDRGLRKLRKISQASLIAQTINANHLMVTV